MNLKTKLIIFSSLFVLIAGVFTFTRHSPSLHKKEILSQIPSRIASTNQEARDPEKKSTDAPEGQSGNGPVAGNSSPVDERRIDERTGALPPLDFFPNARVITERETLVDGGYQKIRLVETGGKYPFIRIEEKGKFDETSGAPIPLDRQAMVADHLLVKFRPGTSKADIQGVLGKVNATLTKSLGTDTYMVKLSAVDIDLFNDAVTRLKAPAHKVVFAEPDYVQRGLSQIPNDPNFSSLWGMNNVGQAGGVSDSDMDAPEAWDVTTGSPSVVVGVIDTGVDYTHPDLAANIWINPGEIAGNGMDDDGNGLVDDVNGWNFYNDNNEPKDDYYHGTHCSGTIGAVGNNGLGIAGVAWNIKIVPIKFLGADGSGYASDAIACVNYATSLHVRLTSNSWGGGGFSQALKDAIDAAAQQGILFVASAGNNGVNNDATPSYPSSFASSNIIAVAATDMADQLAYFSNYGATKVHVAAPGVNIYSCFPTTQTAVMATRGFPTSYGYLSGTSMAAPHVAGEAALLWSLHPDWSMTQIRDCILTTVDFKANLISKVSTSGRINAANALNAEGPPQPTDIPLLPPWALAGLGLLFFVVGARFLPSTQKS